MIATIKSEWRKNRFRPAFLTGAALIGALTVVAYGVNWYLAFNSGKADRPVLLSSLYPDQFVLNVLDAGFPLGAAMAIVLGAILAGSEFGWGTMKASFTQGPGRLTVWAGRMVVFVSWMFIITAVLFALGAAASSVIAIANGHVITWPALDQLAKAFGSIWLILSVNGALGMALGVVIRHSAAALGIGLVYLLAIEGLMLQFVDSLNNGAYQWIGKLFVDQNATALLQSFASGGPAPLISAQQAVTVMLAWFVGFAVVAAAALRLRDVT